MADGRDLIVRRTQRYDIVLPARFVVDDEHLDRVRYSGRGRDGWIDADVMDFGAGGVGFMCEVFIPRKALLRIRIFPPGSNLSDQPIDEEQIPLLEGTVRVQRVVMTDRRPGYLVGTSFTEPNQKLDRQIDEMLELLKGDDVDDLPVSKAG